VTYTLDTDIQDYFVFLGDSPVDGHVSFTVSWTPTGPERTLKPGSSDPTSPFAFAGSFRDAAPTATFSGSNVNGFSFTGSATSDGNIFSEIGHERNGVFLG